MIEQVLLLQPDDNVITLGDQLNRTQAERVILVIPPDNELFRRRLDLQIIVRQVRRRKIDLALVTDDLDLRAHARDLQVPVFSSVRRAQGRRWRWPWQTRPGKRPARTRAFLAEEDMHEMRKRRKRHQRLRLVARVLGVVFFLLVVALVGSLVYVLVPGAEIRLVPASEDVQVVLPIVAVPGLERVDYPGGQIPARAVSILVEGTASISTSGVRDLPDAVASGTVMFTNLLPQEVAVPAGTSVRTTSGTPVRFVTVQAISVPPSGQATVGIRAVDPGPAGNVDENMINLVEGAPGLALRVINPSPTDGGTSRQVSAVTQADRDALKVVLLKELRQQAMVDMGATAKETEFVAADSLQIVGVEDETYDHFVGEEANLLNLDMRVTVTGVAIDEQAARALVYDALLRKAGAGYDLIPAALRFRRGEVTEVDGRGAVTFFMQGWGARTARIDVEGLTRAVLGKPVDEAGEYLSAEVALRRPPMIDVWPEGYERLPYMAFRISTDVVVDGQ